MTLFFSVPNQIFIWHHCVHMTARQRKVGYHSVPFNASLRTSALCQGSDSYNAVYSQIYSLLSQGQGEPGKLRSTDGGNSLPSPSTFLGLTGRI